MPTDPLVSLIVPAPSGDIATRAEAVLEAARTVTITTAEQYTFAASELKAVKGKAAELEELRKSLKAPVLEAGRRIDAHFARPLAFLAEAESLIKQGMVAFSEQQEQQRRAEQVAANERARKERERLEAQAHKAAAAGKLERAAELGQRAETVVAPVIMSETPKIAGQSLRESWQFELLDEQLLPREYLTPDLPRIRRVVSAMKGDTRIPGVRVWSEKRLASGT